MTDYKTDYSRKKNINTLDKGSYDDWGDLTPAKQVLSKQPDGHDYEVVIKPKGLIKYIYNDIAAAPIGSQQLLNSYTVPAGSEATVVNIKVSGDNRAKFLLKLNGDNKDSARIWWANFNARLIIDGSKLVANDKIEVFVINHGEVVAPFESTIGVDEYAI